MVHVILYGTKNNIPKVRFKAWEIVEALQRMTSAVSVRLTGSVI
jgi:hypothetical protein